MEKAMREKRYEDFKDLAHAMKGSAGSVGAQLTLYDVCSASQACRTRCSARKPLR